MRKYSNNLDINDFIHIFLRKNKEWYFEKGKKHNKLCSPNKQKYIIPCTPRCPRAYQNFKHDIMKVDGVRL